MTNGINWENRIVDTGFEDPTQLLANPHNYRIHPKEQQEALQDGLDRIGWISPVIVNRTTGNMIDGHLRVTVAMRKDEKQVPVQYVELSEEEEKIALAIYDRITELAGHDEEILRGLLDDIDLDSDALEAMFDDLLRDSADLEPINAGEGESTSGESHDHLILCGERIPLSEAEAIGLKMKLDQYKSEYGMLMGFGSYLLEGSHDAELEP